MDKPENPPAFPLADHYSYDGLLLSEGSQGMTLRDWFAGQALAGLCGNSGGPYQANSMTGWAIVNCHPGDVAGEAYRLADAMLAQREAGQ